MDERRRAWTLDMIYWMVTLNQWINLLSVQSFFLMRECYAQNTGPILVPDLKEMLHIRSQTSNYKMYPYERRKKINHYRKEIFISIVGIFSDMSTVVKETDGSH